jgi:hypothetical protein
MEETYGWKKKNLLQKPDNRPVFISTLILNTINPENQLNFRVLFLLSKFLFFSPFTDGAEEAEAGGCLVDEVAAEVERAAMVRSLL